PIFLFVILSLMKIREKIIQVIPQDLKYAIASGIGFFITFVGLKNAGIVREDADTFVQLGDLTEPMTALALFGLIVTIIMLALGINGAIFYGMVVTTLIGLIGELIRTVSSIVSHIPGVAPTFGVVLAHILVVFSLEMLAVIFTFLFVAFFDAAGALIALTNQAGIMKNGKIPNIEKALL